DGERARQRDIRTGPGNGIADGDRDDEVTSLPVDGDGVIAERVLAATYQQGAAGLVEVGVERIERAGRDDGVVVSVVQHQGDVVRDEIPLPGVETAVHQVLGALERLATPRYHMGYVGRVQGPVCVLGTVVVARGKV